MPEETNGGSEPGTTGGPAPEPRPSGTSGGSWRDRPGLVAGAAVLVVAVVAVIVIVIASGGSDSDSNGGGDGTTAGLPPNIVTDDDIAAQDQGTPQRALLEWWQAFQFQDALAVERLTSPDTVDEIGENQLAALVEARGRGLQGIEVLGASESGDSASVRVGLLTFQPENPGEPPPDEPTASQPTTFAMLKEGDEWLFNQPAYLEPMVESLKAAEEQQQSQDSSGG